MILLFVFLLTFANFANCGNNFADCLACLDREGMGWCGSECTSGQITSGDDLTPRKCLTTKMTMSGKQCSDSTYDLLSLVDCSGESKTIQAASSCAERATILGKMNLLCKIFEITRNNDHNNHNNKSNKQTVVAIWLALLLPS